MGKRPETFIHKYRNFGGNKSHQHYYQQWNCGKTNYQANQNKDATNDFEGTGKISPERWMTETDFSNPVNTRTCQDKLLNSFRQKNKTYDNAN